MFYFFFAISRIVTFRAFVRSKHVGPFAYISEIGLLTFQLSASVFDLLCSAFERSAYVFTLVEYNGVRLIVSRNKLLRFQHSVSGASADSFRPPGIFTDEAFALGFFHKLSFTQIKRRKTRRLYTGSGLRDG